MDFSTDEYFGTLGQGLMKDLLADLQVEDGDWSLDQLEKELAQLDHDPSQKSQFSQTLPPLDAASLVVQHAKERTGSAGLNSTAFPQSNDGMDAWSLSLEKFTALSLQEEFLAADSIRKQQQQQSPFPAVPPPHIPNSNLDSAEDYDIAEKLVVAPPPGLGGTMTGAASGAPNPKTFPKTPQNSLSIPDDPRIAASGVLPGAPAAASAPNGAPPVAPVMAMQQFMPPPGVMPPPGAFVGGIPGMPPGVMPAMPPMAMPPHAGLAMMPPSIPGTNQPIPLAMPAGGAAWQTPQRLQVAPTARAFCDPHPNAPPIPATSLETKHMSSRDIAFVIHAILKPVLAQGVPDNDYFMEFLRRTGAQAKANNPKQAKDMEKEMMSREAKAKEWSTEKSVLGHVAKTNVARPRALIATAQLSSTEKDSEQKQRASLWKARVYCDQAYQSYMIIVDIWRAAPPGSVPPQLQSHLVKLMKCMGITHVEKEYKVDVEALKLLCKLSKGRSLIARILEKALLPPNAVQTILPYFLQLLLPASSKRDDPQGASDIATERLLGAITGVMEQLNTPPETLLKCMESVQVSGKDSFSSHARRACAYTLLRKGSVVVGHDESAENRAAWAKAESEIMMLI